MNLLAEKLSGIVLTTVILLCIFAVGGCELKTFRLNPSYVMARDCVKYTKTTSDYLLDNAPSLKFYLVETKSVEQSADYTELNKYGLSGVMLTGELLGGEPLFGREIPITINTQLYSRLPSVFESFFTGKRVNHFIEVDIHNKTYLLNIDYFDSSGIVTCIKQ